MQFGFIQANELKLMSVIVEFIVRAKRERVLVPSFLFIGGLAVVADKSEADSPFHAKVISDELCGLVPAGEAVVRFV